MQKCYLILLLGAALQQATASIDKDLQGLNMDTLGDIAANLSSNVDLEKDAKKWLAEKCTKNGGEEAYLKAEKAQNETIACFTNLVNFGELQKEMEEAKPSGDLDSVFKKYCSKSPEMVGCVEKFTTELEPCLEDKEKKSKNIILNVTTQLVEFVCHKEGDRIALFIAEGGPECLNASEKGIKQCFQTVFQKYMPEDGEEVGLERLPVLFQAEDCEDFSKLQRCVVRELEKCKEATPGNIIDSVFNYIRKVTPCSNFKPPETVQAGAGATASSALSHAVLVSALFALGAARYVI